MEKAKIDKIVEALELADKSKPMYIGPLKIQSATNFLHGVAFACHTLGLEMFDNLRDARDDIAQERGWKMSSVGVWYQMQKKGWPEEAIVDELFAIEIEAWKRLGSRLKEE